MADEPEVVPATIGLRAELKLLQESPAATEEVKSAAATLMAALWPSNATPGASPAGE